LPDMRFAPPKRLRIADREQGLNQISVRSHNERLVLSLLLQNHGISRLEIGQRSGLSAQTVSVIVRSLEQEGLVVQGTAQRGRVGPPTIPMSLNPKGAYSVGVSIGSRKTDIVLIDFVGTVLHSVSLPYLSPQEARVHAQLLEAIRQAIEVLPVKMRARVAGVGLALPVDIDTWDMPRDGTGKSLNGIQNELEAIVGLPVFVQNDITAAASGESMFGVAQTMTDYLFFFLGERLHSRLVLNHQIYSGNYKISPQSVDAGILRLEDELIRGQIPVDDLWSNQSTWPRYAGLLEPWRNSVCGAQVDLVKSLAQFINVDTVVLSSYAPRGICQDICDGLKRALPGMCVVTGEIAVAPIAVGAASLPFSSRFMVQANIESPAL
jgi:DNA-binding Lrp family transcriptional regulator